MRRALVLFALLVGGCQRPYQNGPDLLQEPIETAHQRCILIYLIHGDGSYLYHDSEGRGRLADEEALREALFVAEGMPHAEVFIFHLKRRMRFLFFFPMKDAEYYHYLDGRRLTGKSYSSAFDLSGEAEIVGREIVRRDDRTLRVFLYFGHEIPEFGEGHYHLTHPEQPFTVGHLAEGLAGFAAAFRGGRRGFDLLLLSTCFGGTPGTIARLAPYARYIVASPADLHLSYLDSRPLLELAAGDSIRPSVLAHEIARLSFERLAETTQTVVAVCAYDMGRLGPFLKGFGEAEESAGLPGGDPVGRYVDCDELESFDRQEAAQGVEVFYRPPRFGRESSRVTHSGWACWVHGPGQGEGLLKSAGGPSEAP